jgi:glycosyltransferase involved in cell wall biosynthesis
MSKLISIITVNLNNFKGLELTINSVLNQTFQDFEFILIDGGSTDGSELLLDSYSDRFSFSISENDNGIFDAMNKGILHSTGQYLLFLNSGDWLISNDSLEKVFNCAHDSDIIIAGTRVSHNGKIIHTTSPQNEISLQTFWYNTIPHQSCFIKKKLFDEYGLYDISLKYHGDYDFWIRTIILNNCSIESIGEIITDYNLEGISSQDSHKEMSKYEMNQVLSRYFSQRILSDYKIWEESAKNMEPLFWIYRKYFFKLGIGFLYSFAKMVVKLFKKSSLNV